MSANPIKTIWYNESSSSFYRIAEEVKFLEGNYLLQRFDGVLKKVDERSLANYKIEAGQVEKLLSEEFEQAKKTISRVTNALSQFALLTGKSEDVLSDHTDSDASFFGVDQSWMSDLIATVQNESATEEQRQEAFKQSFENIPDISSFFNKESLEKATKNPEAWAKEMEEKILGNEIKAKKEAQKKRRKSEIDAQIRANIEEAMKKGKTEK